MAEQDVKLQVLEEEMESSEEEKQLTVDVVPSATDNHPVIDEFRSLPNEDQLKMLTSLLTVASPEVKFHFQVLIEQITMYDIISAVPLEISEKIFLILDMSSLLKCRQVSLSLLINLVVI